MNEQEKVQEARKKLAERFVGSSTKLGGKGTMKRKHKVVHKVGGKDDKKTKDLIKKLGAQPLPEISEINLKLAPVRRLSVRLFQVLSVPV